MKLDKRACRHAANVPLHISLNAGVLYEPTAFSADWDDDETILSVIHELNFGRCTPQSQ